MNEHHQQDELALHYMEGGYSYPVSDCFGHFLGAPSPYSNMGQVHEQDTAYWSMNMNAFRYEPSRTEDMHYGVYAGCDHVPSMDFSMRAWDYSIVANTEGLMPVDVVIPSEEDVASAVHSLPENGTFNDQDVESSQILWQDDIDPDNMTYEELLDLGESVGRQSRGLSQELIDQLPTSKHKSGGIFSRGKSTDRCVICLMRYKRGDRLINLPCKHAYHADCGCKWLSINKTCPVCNKEVFGDGSKC